MLDMEGGLKKSNLLPTFKGLGLANKQTKNQLEVYSGVKKISMSLVKVRMVEVIEGDCYNGFCRRGEMAGSTLKTLRKRENL